MRGLAEEDPRDPSNAVSQFFEMSRRYGPGQITGLARLGGTPVGVWANDGSFYAVRRGDAKILWRKGANFSLAARSIQGRFQTSGFGLDIQNRFRT